MNGIRIMIGGGTSMAECYNVINVPLVYGSGRQFGAIAITLLLVWLTHCMNRWKRNVN
jgi:hypothetical protein